jgi:HAD superfamily hydrolase (TIGR01509 family)
VSIELVIFDCDGVLVDSEPLANRVMTDALNEIGINLRYEEVCSRFIGLSMARVVELVEELLGRPVPGFEESVQRRTFERFRHELRPIAGTEDALARLGLPYCVASSGELEKMRLTLGLTGLLCHFEGRMFSATQVARGKPAPDLFLFSAAQMHVDAGACVVVEDSVPGVLAARAAGMAVFGYDGTGFGPALSEAGACVFSDMRELPDLLERARGDRLSR